MVYFAAAVLYVVVAALVARRSARAFRSWDTTPPLTAEPQSD